MICVECERRAFAAAAETRAESSWFGGLLASPRQHVHDVQLLFHCNFKTSCHLAPHLYLLVR